MCTRALAHSADLVSVTAARAQKNDRGAGSANFRVLAPVKHPCYTQDATGTDPAGENSHEGRVLTMRLHWLLSKYYIRRMARRHGFLDPFTFFGRLQRFAQPSEVVTPIELLRSGIQFHARGLINTRAIQHNLDWIWPYWVERQFNPDSDSFLPRAFSITHVNLTHRNWTAIGIPDCSSLPIVDPRGLVTPFWDGWSLDAWVFAKDGGGKLVPSRCADVCQQLECGDRQLAVVTTVREGNWAMTMRAEVVLHGGVPVARLSYQACADRPAWLILGLRPYNPEGISFISDVTLTDDRSRWIINDLPCVRFHEAVERHAVSEYRRGDVARNLGGGDDANAVACDVGLATAAAMFDLAPNSEREVSATVHIMEDPSRRKRRREDRDDGCGTWEDALAETARLSIPDEHMQFLYDAAVRTLVLHSPGTAFPGPYTYKRFWYRDAVFIVNALLHTNQLQRARRVLDHFPNDQTVTGFFHSQDGEWDANGAVLWCFGKYCELTGESPPFAWYNPVCKGGKWLQRKRVSAKSDALHAGLLPAGFSAEHLGNNDYYYWDDFWGVAGLQAGARLLEAYGDTDLAEVFRSEAQSFRDAVERSLARSRDRRQIDALPASPYRRMDAGAVGSIVCAYPLHLLDKQDPRLRATVDYLIANCFTQGAFFQDMIHSGINAYLSLHVAQVLLRMGDARFSDIVKAVAGLCSPTGQWPEAIHPRTHGGCMGDGQHAWAAAEWVMMLRNMFLREDDQYLVVGSGILPEWLEPGNRLRFGPSPTRFGTCSVDIEAELSEIRVGWAAEWRGIPPTVIVTMPGAEPVAVAEPDEHSQVKVAR